MDEHDIAIETLTHGPFGLGRHEGKAILVPYTTPGDIARVRIIEDRKRYALGELVKLIEPGSSRTTAPCPYAGRCGGCSWQHVNYESQLSGKQKNLADALARTGGLKGVQVLPILAAAEPFHYRRRIRLHKGPGGIGFRQLLSHKIVPVDACLIAKQAVSDSIPLAAEWAQALRTPVSSIEIVSSCGTEVIFVGKAGRNFEGSDERVCREFVAAQATLAGIVLSGSHWRRHWGESQVSYSIGENCHLRIDADAFSQVNAQGNRQLITQLMHWGSFEKRDCVLELYAGAGNLTLPMARHTGEIIAIEAHAALVRNGKRNSRRYGLDNIAWRCQSAQSAVADLVRARSSFSKVVLNPPRSGAKEVVDNLGRLGAQRILYVACDPATMARDIARLCALGYHLERARPIDLFPQTHHVETLAELRRATQPREHSQYL